MTTDTRDGRLTREARDWLLDLAWLDDVEDLEEQVESLSPDEVRVRIESMYEGGWRQFVRDSE